MLQKIYSRNHTPTRLSTRITAVLLVSAVMFFQVVIETRVTADPIGEQDFGAAKVVINFDSLEDRTPVSIQFLSLGVQFSNDVGGFPGVVRATDGARSQPNILCGGAAGSRDQFNPDIFLTLTTPVTAVGGDIISGNPGRNFLRVFGPNGEIETVTNNAGTLHQFVALRPSFPITRAQFGGTVFCIDDVTFERGGCMTNVKRLSQGDPLWANDLYDHSTTNTIKRKGCALTSLSMALNFAGLANDPGSLNQFMSKTDHDYSRGDVSWGPTTRDGSNGTLIFNGFRSKLKQTLDDALCKGFPVIVGVKLNARGKPGHYVVVTGKQGNKYLIADPGFAGRTTLDDYNNKFETRGYVRKARPANRNSADSTFANLMSLQDEHLSELDLAVGDSAELLVVHSSGQRTGFDSSSGTSVEEIAGSSYFNDSLDDDETGESATETGHLMQIKEPDEGTYRVDLVGVKLGTYILSIRTFSQDGSPQPPIVIEGITGIGSTSTFQLQLALGTGAISTLVRAATVQSTLNDIHNSRELGLIDNAGIAQALSSKLMAAQEALARGNAHTAREILEAFKAQVTAQAAKHIDPLAAQVLFEDADFLQNQIAQ